MEKIKVWIVDDHPLITEGIAASIDKYAAFEVVGRYHNGQDFMNVVQPADKGIVLLDLEMPLMDGREVLKQLLEHKYAIKPLIITALAAEKLIDVLHLGIKGYVFKTADTNVLVTALKELCENEYHFDREVSEQLFKPSKSIKTLLEKLTDSERNVLQHIAQGYSCAAIAEKQSLSVRTVETHKQNLMKKLNLHKTALLVKAYFEGQ